MEYNAHWPDQSFEQFTRSTDWQALPFTIKLALLHLRRAEAEPAIGPPVWRCAAMGHLPRRGDGRAPRQRGRRSGLERAAHFFLELAERLSLIGEATTEGFKCPLSQFVLADALGLTAIHINRILRQLRKLRLLTQHKGMVQIHDLRELKKLAGFEGGYLEMPD